MTDAEHARAIKEALKVFTSACQAAKQAGLDVSLHPEYAGRFTKDAWSPYTLESAGLNITRTIR